MAGKTIYAGIMQIQQNLKAPKDKDGGKYKYRSAEDILENVKPLLQQAGLIVLFKDTVKTDEIGSYIESTCQLIDIATGDSEESVAIAREDTATKFMSPGQASGAAISFARKYALCGMFAIDNEDDLDSKAYQEARQTSQNDAQATEKKNKGKSTNKDNKVLYNEADAVRKANINKLNAEIKRLGAKPEDVKNLAEFNFKKKSVNDMSDTEICVLTENLERWLNGE